MKFYLGTHCPNWLWEDKTNVPLFVSRRTLSKYKYLRPSTSQWALDSGGFSELSLYGEWTTTAKQYVEEVDRFHDEIGSLEWAAAQDYMCEPHILAKTKKTVIEHQRLTVENFLDLKNLRPWINFAPVIQGWESIDYLKHVNMYASKGIFLDKYPIVGIGSICRRQGTEEIEDLINVLHNEFNISLHGFGFKKRGVARSCKALESSDSLAWSFEARRAPVLLENHTHKNCANCLEWALMWRESLISLIEGNK